MQRHEPGLRGSNLLGARFHNASLNSARFNDANLNGAAFPDADSTSCSWSGGKIGAFDHHVGQSFRTSEGRRKVRD